MIWTILGFSVVIVAFFCITVAETLVGKPIFEQNRMYVAAAFVAAGVASWFIGRYLGDKAGTVTREGEEPAANTRFVLFDLRYWGPMLVALGIITVFIRPLKQEKVEVAQPPRPPAKTAEVAVVVAPPPAPEPEPRAPAVFPPLKMQGVIFREAQPFVIINGQSYAVGDHVGQVLVKAIDRTSVLLELAGESMMLTLN